VGEITEPTPAICTMALFNETLPSRALPALTTPSRPTMAVSTISPVSSSTTREMRPVCGIDFVDNRADIGQRLAGLELDNLQKGLSR
jgi:hypothetical protein